MIVKVPGPLVSHNVTFFFDLGLENSEEQLTRQTEAIFYATLLDIEPFLPHPFQFCFLYSFTSFPVHFC